MARNISEKLVCDKCGTNIRVKPYTVVAPEGARVVDLCDKDAKPLRELFDLGSGEPRRRAASERASGHRVVPVD